MNAMNTSASPVLDPAQLRRIEGVHRGFLYQHLYGAGCLLSAPVAGVVAVLVERDEDIELLSPERQDYIQVKTRSRPLRKADITDALARFATLRDAHENGRREGTARFYIVSNAVPGPELLAEFNSDAWQQDVILLWPGREPGAGAGMPPAWANLAEAVRWCTDRAEAIPYRRISGETLAWKLAARIHLAATGAAPGESHRIATVDLPVVFEQLVIQLQDFPEPPTSYRPQVSEPAPQSPARVRLIVGLSGAGKTAWAAEVAVHSTIPLTYYDIGDTPGAALPAALSREVAARFFARAGVELGGILFPAATGQESLRVLDATLAQRGITVMLVIDNIQRVSPRDILAIVAITPHIRYILLSQPQEGQAELEALLDIRAEELGGWSTDTIGEEFAREDCPLAPRSSRRLLRLTGGLPLYVRNAAYLTRTHYDRRAATLCDELEAQTHIAHTAQEIILGRVLAALPPETRDAIAVLALADMPLAREEATTLLEAVGVARIAAARLFRELAGLGIVRYLGDRRLQIHDAFRLIAAGHRAAMRQEVISAARLTLRTALEQAIMLAPGDVARTSLYLRLLPETGATDTLVDLAGSELLYELGLAAPIRSALENAASAEALGPRDRFWALDTLAYWDYQRGAPQEMARRLAGMRGLLPQIEDAEREAIALSMKSMLFHARRGDIASARRLFTEVVARTGGDSGLRRILRYNFAVALYHNHQFTACAAEAADLVREYYGLLGLTERDVFGRNPPDIAAKLTASPSQQDDLKHVADALDLLAKTEVSRGRRGASLIHTLHAIKFYGLAHAVTSVLGLGQDLIDKFLGDLNDPVAARNFIEGTMLPILAAYELPDQVVPVRAQYAVVLAHGGDFAAATREMAQLAVFAEALPEERRRELEQQRHFIEAIVRGEVRPGQRPGAIPPQPTGQDMPSVARRVGRNEACPCGSGMKYKHCHGKNRR